LASVHKGVLTTDPPWLKGWRRIRGLIIVMKLGKQNRALCEENPRRFFSGTCAVEVPMCPLYIYIEGREEREGEGGRGGKDGGGEREGVG
jgi:hypothetical protein